MTNLIEPRAWQYQAQDTVYALAASDGVLFAARTSGLARSVDGGSTWQNAFASLENPAGLTATAVVCAGKTVFAGVKGAVLRSDDAGDTWQIAALAAPPPTVVALVLSPNFDQDGVLFAGTAEDGVFVSSDGGVTWIPWNFALLDLNIGALAVSPDYLRDETIFAGTESGMFDSENGGRSWQEVPFPVDAGPVLSLATPPTYAIDGCLYAGTEKNGLWVSTDWGARWQQIRHDDINGAVNAIIVEGAKLWLLLDDRLLVSTDHGLTWARHPAQLPANRLAMTLLLHAGATLVGFADGELLQLS